MDVHIETGDIITDTVHDYGNGRVVHLIAVRAILLGGHMRLHDHDDIRWVTIAEMSDYLFAPADEVVVKTLREEHERERARHSAKHASAQASKPDVADPE